MSFIVRRPVERLQGLFDRVWHVEDAAPAAAAICPDGRSELVLHLADPMHGQGRHLLVAQMDRPITVVPTGRVAMVGARFASGGLHKLLPIAQDRLAGQILDLEAVWSLWTRRTVDRVGEARGPDARLAVFESALEELIPSTRLERSHTPMDVAVARLRASGGSADIRELAATARLSRRQFERHFQTYIGLSPRLFGRIVKFQRAFRLLGRDSGASIAVRCGYADQAHLVREIRRFAGQTPTNLAVAEGLTTFFRD